MPLSEPTACMVEHTSSRREKTPGLGAFAKRISRINQALTTFDQIAHNLVVEVLDGGPLNAFPLVLFLFSLQRQLNEELLKLLVNIVDAELLESIFLVSC